jgi:hypothetical protein
MNTLNLYICSSNGYSCLLALGEVEEAQKIFEMCLKSNHLSNLDHKIVEEASDGLQKVQVEYQLNFWNCAVGFQVHIYLYYLLKSQKTSLQVFLIEIK